MINSWGTGRGFPCLSLSLLVLVLATPQVQSWFPWLAGLKGCSRRYRFRDGVEIDLVEVDFKPFLSAVQSNLKNLPLEARAMFVSYFVYYLVPASLLKAVKGLCKASWTRSKPQDSEASLFGFQARNWPGTPLGGKVLRDGRTQWGMAGLLRKGDEGLHPARPPGRWVPSCLLCWPRGGSRGSCWWSCERAVAFRRGHGLFPRVAAFVHYSWHVWVLMSWRGTQSWRDTMGQKLWPLGRELVSAATPHRFLGPYPEPPGILFSDFGHSGALGGLTFPLQPPKTVPSPTHWYHSAPGPFLLALGREPLWPPGR